MTTTYPARVRTGTRSRDVQNPLFKEAEQRVLDWLLAGQYPVVDLRAQKTYCDFRIGPPNTQGQAVFTLDVKCDQYAASTGRVAWEMVVENRGQLRLGWGMYEELDYVAFVLPAQEQWQLYIVDVQAVQRLIRAEQLVEGRDYKSFDKHSEDGRRAEGMAVRIEVLRSKGCVVAEDKV